jgi:hypothetical protein
MSPVEVITKKQDQKLDKWILKDKGSKIIKSISEDNPSIIIKTSVINDETLVQEENKSSNRDGIVLIYTSKQEAELKEKRIIHPSRYG